MDETRGKDFCFVESYCTTTQLNLFFDVPVFFDRCLMSIVEPKFVVFIVRVPLPR